MGKFGVDTSFVAGASLAAWEGALRKNTKLLFLETPSNPLTEIADIAALATSGQARGRTAGGGQLFLYAGAATAAAAWR